MNLPFALGLLFPGVLFLVFVERSSFYTHWVWFSTFDTIIGLLIVPALLVAAAGTLAPSRVNRLAEWAGQRSYGLYLWHFPVILVAYERGIAYAPPVLNHWWGANRLCPCDHGHTCRRELSQHRDARTAVG